RVHTATETPVSARAWFRRAAAASARSSAYRRSSTSGQIRTTVAARRISTRPGRSRREDVLFDLLDPGQRVPVRLEQSSATAADAARRNMAEQLAVLDGQHRHALHAPVNAKQVPAPIAAAAGTIQNQPSSKPSTS